MLLVGLKILLCFDHNCSQLNFADPQIAWNMVLGLVIALVLVLVLALVLVQVLLLVLVLFLALV